MTADERPPATHVVEWKDEDGNTYVWPHAMSESSMRRDRVLDRLARYGMPCDESTLRIWKIVPEICNCEHGDHFDTDHFGKMTPLVGHDYGSLEFGSVPALYVGQVCTACANTHMKEYLA